MRNYLPIIFSFVLGILLAMGAKKLLHLYIDRFFGKKINLIGFKYVILFFALFAVFWTYGKWTDSNLLLMTGASMMAILNIFSLVLIIFLPWPLILFSVTDRVKRKKSAAPMVNFERRHFIKVAASALPVMALGTAGSGMAGSFQPVAINKIPMYFKNLPSHLDGFKILHLSDLHLGYYFHLSDLEKTMQLAEKFAPDLVLVTGDVADDLKKLPDALKIIDQLNTTHGKFMSLGNHEYMRGIKDVKQIVAAGPVPLLINDGQRIIHSGSPIFLGGADDPKRMRGDVDPFLDKAIQETMTMADDNDFKILMSHRPKALDVAGKYNVDLILSGHTHGGQIILNGKSAFEGMVDREPYLWGKYKKNQTQLYTSAGMGHWFPFRLNCPPEAPLIELKRST